MKTSSDPVKRETEASAPKPGASPGGTSSTPVRIISINPDVKDHFGHYLAFERRLADEAARMNLEYLVLGSLMAGRDIQDLIPLHPTFQHNSWATYAPGILRDTSLDYYRCAKDFEQRITAAIKKLGIDDSDTTNIFFMYLAHPRHVAGAIRLGELFGGRHPIVLNLFWLHFIYGFPESKTDTSLRSFFQLNRASRKRNNVHLCHDSELLAEKLAQDIPEPMGHLPMFSVTDFSSLEEQSGENLDLRSTQQLRIVCPSNMRYEKGYDLSCSLASELGRENVEVVLRRVIINSTEKDLIKLAASVTDATFIDGVLDPDQFVRLLAGADVIVLPYRTSEFYSRTSGLFADAMHLGIPMVGTRGTWLGDHIEQFQCGATFEDGSVTDLAEAVAQVLDHLEEFRSNIRRQKSSWLEKNNPRAVLRFLLNYSDP